MIIQASDILPLPVALPIESVGAFDTARILLPRTPYLIDANAVVHPLRSATLKIHDLKSDDEKTLRIDRNTNVTVRFFKNGAQTVARIRTLTDIPSREAVSFDYVIGEDSSLAAEDTSGTSITCHTQLDFQSICVEIGF